MQLPKTLEQFGVVNPNEQVFWGLDTDQEFIVLSEYKSVLDGKGIGCQQQNWPFESYTNSAVQSNGSINIPIEFFIEYLRRDPDDYLRQQRMIDEPYQVSYDTIYHFIAHFDFYDVDTQELDMCYVIDHERLQHVMAASEMKARVRKQMAEGLYRDKTGHIYEKEKPQCQYCGRAFTAEGDRQDHEEECDAKVDLKELE